MNLFDLYAKIALDTSDYDDNVKSAAKIGENLASKLGSGLATAGKLAAGGVALVGGAATAAISGMVALEGATEEFRIAQGKLNTAFEAAGYSVETASTAYNAFYGILGDTDTATEASQLLAKLALNAEDMGTWTNIAAGVWGTFGDSLPIEGLIESANETAKVGQVTGSLADALNWAGISEDAFNEQLTAAGSEAERNQLIMNTLSSTYDAATDAFYRNNEALVASREAQAQLDASLAELGGSISTIKNGLMSEFMPAISQVATGLAGMLSGDESGSEQFTQGIEQMVSGLSEKLPQFLEFGAQILVTVANGIVSSLPSLVEKLPEIILTIINTLLPLLPQLLQVGLQAIITLANGIAQSLPELVPQIVDVILQIVNVLTDPNNLSMLVDAAIAIVVGLTEGIINALPALIERAPEIIMNLVTALVENVPKLLEAAQQIVISLVQGIIMNLPQIYQSAYEIIGSLISGLISMFGNLYSTSVDMVKNIWNAVTSIKWVDLGKNIIGGIINGVKSMIGSAISAVAGVAGSMFEAVTGFFDINSPSRLTRDKVGKNIVLGMVAGIEDEEGAAVNAMTSLSRKVAGVNMDFGIIGNANYSYSGRSNGVVQTGGTVVNQYIQAVPMTPAELARQSVDAFDRLRWA